MELRVEFAIFSDVTFCRVQILLAAGEKSRDEDMKNNKENGILEKQKSGIFLILSKMRNNTGLFFLGGEADKGDEIGNLKLQQFGQITF